MSKMRAAPPLVARGGRRTAVVARGGRRTAVVARGGRRPLSSPAVGAESYSPAAGAEPLSSPAGRRTRYRRPRRAQNRCRPPAAGAEPLSSPAAGAEPLSSPVVSVAPLSSPVERPPGPCAAAAGDSMLIPMHKHNSAAIKRCFISGPFAVPAASFFPGRGPFRENGPRPISGEKPARAQRGAVPAYILSQPVYHKAKNFPLPILRQTGHALLAAPRPGWCAGIKFEKNHAFSPFFSRRRTRAANTCKAICSIH